MVALKPFLAGLLANVIETKLNSSDARPGKLSSRFVSGNDNALSRDTRFCGKDPAEKTLQNGRLSISQSRRRKWDVVFEVKSSKYTLFAPILLPPYKR